jgi:hypothetical protein
MPLRRARATVHTEKRAQQVDCVGGCARALMLGNPLKALTPHVTSQTSPLRIFVNALQGAAEGAGKEGRYFHVLFLISRLPLPSQFVNALSDLLFSHHSIQPAQGLFPNQFDFPVFFWESSLLFTCVSIPNNIYVRITRLTRMNSGRWLQRTRRTRRRRRLNQPLLIAP